MRFDNSAELVLEREEGKMIIRISGGLGNQMFQYALKKKLDYVQGRENQIDLSYYNKKTVHNGYELNQVFGINDFSYMGRTPRDSFFYIVLCKILYKCNIKMFKTKTFLLEPLIAFYSNYKSLSGEFFYIDGYWQSEDYFADYAEEIRKCFTFPKFDESENISLLKKISNVESVAMHVRRGDFIENSRYVCLGKTDYYEKAIEEIRKRVSDPFFVVLSDDIAWCKENLYLGNKVEYVSWNIKEKSYRDMQIMSCCKHNIIANSTFSWWGAWLNTNPQKIVVAPYKFYNGNVPDESHLIPKGWLQISFRYFDEK